MSLSGTVSMAVRTTGRTTTLTAYRLAVLVLFAPNFYFFFFCALDTSLAHLSVVLDLCFRELSVLPEDDVEAKTEDTESYKYQSCY